MPIRTTDKVTTYTQAFLGVLGIPLDAKIKDFLKKLESDGHTEKGISFSIWRSQEKLSTFRYDHRFMSILENEINKWSWKKDDPRWTEYWNKKNEATKAERLRKEIKEFVLDANELERMNNPNGKHKKYKGYIYFIQGQCGGAIKVGFSTIPSERLRQLQTGYPDTLKILLLIPGNESTEKVIHRQFEGSKLNGEWFRPDELVIDKIKELKAIYENSIAKRGVRIG